MVVFGDHYQGIKDNHVLVNVVKKAGHTEMPLVSIESVVRHGRGRET